MKAMLLGSTYLTSHAVEDGEEYPERRFGRVAPMGPEAMSTGRDAEARGYPPNWTYGQSGKHRKSILCI